MKKFNLLLVAGAVIMLSGCWPIGGKDGLIHDRENNYLQNQSTQPLVIPGNLSNIYINNTYAIPPGAAWSPNQPATIVPPHSILALKNPQTQLLGKGPWLGIGQYGEPALLVKGDFKQVWAQVNTALQKAHYKIVGNDPRIGLYAVTRKNTAYQITVLTADQGTVISIQRFNNFPLVAQQATSLLQELEIN